MDITATLKNARMIDVHGEHVTIAADIHGDVHKRWKDGTRIYTSYIEDKLPGDVYVTRSGHTYKVENWRGRDN